MREPIHIYSGGAQLGLAHGDGWLGPEASVGVPTGIAQPPRKGAPAAVAPISVTEEQRALAPWPLNDRFPFITGQQLSASYVSSVFRLCTTGYRLQYVDLLNELLEQDPNLFSVFLKRIVSTANGRFEITPAKLPKDHPDTDEAKKIAEFCQSEFNRIPDLCATNLSLLWSIYHGLSASEIFWDRVGKEWHIDRLGFIHSRRLAYPNFQNWELYIWDQGQVLGWGSPWGNSPTNSNLFGLRVANYPGKFLIHAPMLRGDYPVRDGIGREVAVWALFKRVGARGAVAYLERFAKGFMDVTYSTTKEGKPREANKEDIALAEDIARKLGPGSGSLAAHADSVQINAKSFDGGASSRLTFQEWIGICNAEEAKAVLGGTLGTEVGKGGGNRALGEVQERGEVDLEQYDATALAQSWKRDVLSALVRLNFPGCMHLVPNVEIHVDTDPDPGPLVKLAAEMVGIGAPVDLDKLSETTGIALVPQTEMEDDGKTPKPRRGYLPDVTPPATVDEELVSDEEKQRQADQQDAENDIALQKAKTPPAMPGAQPGAKAAPAPAKGSSKPAKPAAKGKPAAKPAGKAPDKKPTGSKQAQSSKVSKAANLSDRADLADAAVAICWNDQGELLTVSRPEPPHEMALPGGMLEDGESAVSACIRELKEETGVELLELRHVATLRSPTDGRTIHVFAVDDWQGQAAALEDGSRVEFLKPDALFAQSRLYRPTLRQLMADDLLTPPELEADDDSPSPANLALRDSILLSDRGDQKIALQVFDQLLDDYPKQALGWIPALPWSGPKQVALEDIDFSHRKEWKASHEDVTPYVEKIEEGKRKPVILVKTPGNDKLTIVDGHHRTLAYEKLGESVIAYVGTAHTDHGPWDELHDAQKKGSSKGSASWLEKQR